MQDRARDFPVVTLGMPLVGVVMCYWLSTQVVRDQCHVPYFACDASGSVIILLLIAVVMGVRTLRQNDPFSPAGIFPPLFYLFYVAPLLNWISFWPVLPNAGSTIASLVLSGGVGYELAMLGTHKSLQGATVPRLSSDAVEKLCQPAVMWTLLFIVGVCGVLGVGGLIKSGNIPLFSTDPEMARIEFAQEAGGLTTLLTRLPMVGALVVAIIACAAVRQERRVLAMVMVLLFLSQSALLLLLAMRGVLVMVVAVSVIMWHYSVRAVSVRTVISLALVGLGVLGAAAYWRLSAASPVALDVLVDSSMLPPGFPNWLLYPYVTLAYGGLIFSQVVQTIPHEIPFQNGGALIDGALGILPGTQRTLGAFVTQEVMGYGSENLIQLPPTLLGGLYIDFGASGIAVGLFAIAFLSRYLYAKSHSGSAEMLFLYSYWVMHLGITLYSDLIPNSFSWLLPLLVLVTIRTSFAVGRIVERLPAPIGSIR